jgi:hypothetical protein
MFNGTMGEAEMRLPLPAMTTLLPIWADDQDFTSS